MSMKNLLLFLFAVSLWGCKTGSRSDEGQVIRIGNIVDLTHTLTPEFPFIPVKKLTYPFELVPMATLEGNGVEANSWKIHEHLGTHIDAPNHFIANQKSLDQIPLRDLIVPVVVIDIEAKASQNSDAELTLDDIEAFEKQYGRIPGHACVMMYSGWEKHLRDSMFVGLDSMQTKHYPGFPPTPFVSWLPRETLQASVWMFCRSIPVWTKNTWGIKSFLPQASGA